jgi:hypothetical protein
MAPFMTSTVTHLSTRGIFLGSPLDPLSLGHLVGHSVARSVAIFALVRLSAWLLIFSLVHLQSHLSSEATLAGGCT